MTARTKSRHLARTASALLIGLTDRPVGKRPDLRARRRAHVVRDARARGVDELRRAIMCVRETRGSFPRKAERRLTLGQENGHARSVITERAGNGEWLTALEPLTLRFRDGLTWIIRDSEIPYRAAIDRDDRTGVQRHLTGVERPTGADCAAGACGHPTRASSAALLDRRVVVASVRRRRTNPRVRRGRVAEFSGSSISPGPAGAFPDPRRRVFAAATS
jgi:hypothetical protein